MKSRRKPAETCEYCGEPLQRSRTDVYRRRGKKHFVFENVPALVCRACGHRLFEATAVEDMEEQLDRLTRRPRRTELLIVR